MTLIYALLEQVTLLVQTIKKNPTKPNPKKREQPILDRGQIWNGFGQSYELVKTRNYKVS